MKATASQDQHIVIKMTGEAVSARLHPEDDSSIAVLNEGYMVPHSLLWTLPAPCVPCLKASCRQHPIFLLLGKDV